MMRFIFLAILSAVAVEHVFSEECQLPQQLVGEWTVNLGNWDDVTITSTTIDPIKVKNMGMKFTCFANNGSTYALESPAQVIAAGSVTYHYYTCLEIVPSDSSLLVFFHIRTGKNSNLNNEPFLSFLTTDNRTMDDICNVESSPPPLNYTFFLKKDYEAEMGNVTCPSSLQAQFSVNFTDDSDYRKCPQGFDLNGCDLMHLDFNYTNCGGGDQGYSGSVNYTCLAYMETSDAVYTIVHLQEGSGQQGQNNPYTFACMEQAVQGGNESLATITKSANGVCGGTPSVDMVANETVSCRTEPVTTTETTPAGSDNSTQASNTSTPSNQGPGTGDGGQGGGGSSVSSWGLATFVLPVLITVMAAVTM